MKYGRIKMYEDKYAQNPKITNVPKVAGAAAPLTLAQTVDLKPIVAGDFVLEPYSPYHYKATLNGDTKYIAMTGGYVNSYLHVSFTHKLKKIILRHLDATNATATTVLTFSLERASDQISPANMRESMLSTKQLTLCATDITIQLNEAPREATVYHLQLLSTSGHRIYITAYVATDPAQENIGDPQLCLDGIWNPSLVLIQPTQVTTNAYVALSNFPTYIGNSDKLTVVLTETAAQDTMYRIELSNDNSVWIVQKTDANLLASTSVNETLTDRWAYIRISVIDKVGGTHGSVAARLQGGPVI